MFVTEKNFNEIITSLQGEEIIAVDTETNWCQHQNDRYIMGVSIYGNGESYYFPFRHKHDMKLHDDDENLPITCMGPLVNLLQEKITVWHNAKFDLRQFHYEGYNVEDWKFYDTMLLSYMENENKFTHSLYELGKLVGEKKLGNEIHKVALPLGGWDKRAATKDKAMQVGWSKIPPSVMGKYAEEDVVITWKLFKLFYPRVEADEQLQLWPREAKVSNMIRQLEDRGVAVDIPMIENLVKETQHEMQRLEAELGFDPMKPSQLAHALYGRPPEGLGFLPELHSSRPSSEFPQGIPTMNEAVLSKLLPNETVAKVLQYRGLVKAQSTWYQGWLDKVAPDQRLHPDFKQHGTVSTRWSCANPNLQQLPRGNKNDKVKKTLRATEGFQLWEFDYSQVEFRLGSLYAVCDPILQAYKEGGDVHKITAQNIGAYNKFPDDPERARYVGKQTNFLTIYGGGAGVLRKQLWRDAKLDVSEKDCKDILDKFHSAYPEFRNVMADVEASARRKGFVKLWNGRKCHFQYEHDYRKAYNRVIQGGAAQIMIESMLKLHEKGYQLVAQVHDSVWIELEYYDDANMEAQVTEVQSIMEWASEDFELPFPVDAKRLA